MKVSLLRPFSITGSRHWQKYLCESWEENNQRRIFRLLSEVKATWHAVYAISHLWIEPFSKIPFQTLRNSLCSVFPRHIVIPISAIRRKEVLEIESSWVPREKTLVIICPLFSSDITNHKAASREIVSKSPFCHPLCQYHQHPCTPCFKYSMRSYLSQHLGRFCVYHH